MTLNEALAGVRISQVWSELGGGPIVHGRGRGFWPETEGHAVTVDDRTGCWCDTVADVHGRILELIRAVFGCKRQFAVTWLADTFRLNIDHKPESSRDRAVMLMVEERDFHLEAFHRTARLLSAHNLNHPRAAGWAEACERHKSRYRALDAEIRHLKPAPTRRAVA